MGARGVFVCSGPQSSSRRAQRSRPTPQARRPVATLKPTSPARSEIGPYLDLKARAISAVAACSPPGVGPRFSPGETSAKYNRTLPSESFSFSYSFSFSRRRGRGVGVTVAAGVPAGRMGARGVFVCPRPQSSSRRAQRSRPTPPARRPVATLKPNPPDRLENRALPWVTVSPEQTLQAAGPMRRVTSATMSAMGRVFSR